MRGIQRVSTKGMSREEWLMRRRKTIGGSDAAGIEGLLQNRLTKDTGVKGLSLTFCPRVCLYELLFCGNCKAFGRSKADPDSKISAQCG